MNWIFVFLLLLASCTPQEQALPTEGARPSHSLAGGGTDFGSGAESNSKKLHWFPGRSEVTYCIEADSGFGLSRPQLKEMVEQTFHQWNDYVHARLPHAFAQVVRVNPVFRDSCHPFDSTPVNVVFLFDTHRSDSRKAAGKYDDPKGFAHRFEHYGIVWLKKLELRQLSTILLHEVGHLYGNPHVPGTVMAEELADSVETLPDCFLNEIDHTRELAPSYLGAAQDTSILGDAEGLGASAAAIQRLLGRPHLGEVTITYEHSLYDWFAPSLLGQLLSSTQRQSPLSSWISSLEVQDRVGEVKLVSLNDNIRYDYSTGLRVFQVQRESGAIASIENAGALFEGTYGSSTGRPIQLEVEYSRSRSLSGDPVPGNVIRFADDKMEILRF